MKGVFSLLLVLIISINLEAQETPVHNFTTAPSDARFAIIQAQTSAKWTFRLDRYAGRVWQLVRTVSGENKWQQTRVIDLPTESLSVKPRYQLFLSSLAAKHSFLIDVDTGNTWTLTTLADTNGNELEIVWSPFKE